MGSQDADDLGGDPVGLFLAMVVIVLAMLLTLAVAGLVVAYVAFIQQGREIPRAPALTKVLHRACERWGIPTAPDGHATADEEQLRVLHGAHGRHRGSPRD